MATGAGTGPSAAMGMGLGPGMGLRQRILLDKTAKGLGLNLEPEGAEETETEEPEHPHPLSLSRSRSRDLSEAARALELETQNALFPLRLLAIFPAVWGTMVLLQAFVTGGQWEEVYPWGMDTSREALDRLISGRTFEGTWRTVSRGDMLLSILWVSRNLRMAADRLGCTGCTPSWTRSEVRYALLRPLIPTMRVVAARHGVLEVPHLSCRADTSLLGLADRPILLRPDYGPDPPLADLLRPPRDDHPSPLNPVHLSTPHRPDSVVSRLGPDPIRMGRYRVYDRRVAGRADVRDEQHRPSVFLGIWRARGGRHSQWPEAVVWRDQGQGGECECGCECKCKCERKGQSGASR
jgi:hypothetical protein